MTFQNISNVELISRMEKLVRTERKITHLILQYILEIENRKLYADMGYDGMYTYLTRGLHYSEASAYRRLQAAKLLKKVPEVSNKIAEGELNLTQLTQLQKCLKVQQQETGVAATPQDAMNVLEKIKNKNTFETERILALEFNQPVQVHEKIKPQKDNSVRIELTLTQEQFVQLEQAKSLLSHICPDGYWSEIITALAKIYNNKKLKGSSSSSTQRVIAARSNNSMEVDSTPTSTSKSAPTFKHTPTSNLTSTTASAQTSPLIPQPSSAFYHRSRKYIPVEIKRSLLKMAQYCCEYFDPYSNKRCASKYQLELDHIQPWSLGGSNELQNLRVLCRKHNALAADKAGLKFRPK